MDQKQTPEDESGSKLLITFFWVMSVVFVAVVSFIFGRNSISVALKAEPTPTPIESGQTIAQQPTVSQETPTPTPTVDLETACAKTGTSEKKDFLKSYILKEGDTINSIAEKELGDTTRNTEILTLNDNLQQLTIGSILYLPPDFIKHSSGHIVEVSGKISKKDNGSWQLSYGGGEKGPGLWMPGFWFKDIPNADSFKIGDCVTILLDNGVKVYSVKKS